MTVEAVNLDGPPVPPQGRIQLYSSDEWEQFIREWITGLEAEYVQIKSFGGAGDKGADVAAFKTEDGLEGSWDCFQGKHYAKPLSFSVAVPEILKVFLSVCGGEYVMPDTYQFLAPKSCSTQMNQLLSRPTELKKKFLDYLISNKSVKKSIGLDVIGKVQSLAQATDFSMFKSIEILDALDVHSRTRYYAARFATALKRRPAHEPPPDALSDHEDRYVEQLLAVYEERHPEIGFDITNLSANATVGKHFKRQRISFYKAEALRVYARDSVPPGTFEKLEEDIYSGVVDIAEADHSSGFERLSRVLAHVGQLDLNRHKLITVSDNDDRKGICHHLVNENHLTWIDGS